MEKQSTLIKWKKNDENIDTKLINTIKTINVIEHWNTMKFDPRSEILF